MVWLFGLAGSSVIACIAYVFRSLSVSGAIAAIVLGTCWFGLGEPAFASALIAFFISSSVLSKWKKRKKQMIESRYEKTDRRDAFQVLANGGLGLVCLALHASIPEAGWWAVCAGVMASVNADTWATEIGGAVGRNPRKLTTWKLAESGESGAVTFAGLGASLLGGLFIGIVFYIVDPVKALNDYSALLPEGVTLLKWLLIAGLGGFMGSLFDSWLGAAWQQMRKCTVCGKTVESKDHCDRPTEYARGLKWLNNDAVNMISSAAGGGFAWLSALVLGVV